MFKKILCLLWGRGDILWITFFFHYPTQVFQHHSLGEKAVLFPPWIFSVTVVKNQVFGEKTCLCSDGSVSRVSVLIHWCMCLPLPSRPPCIDQYSSMMMVWMSGKHVVACCFLLQLSRLFSALRISISRLEIVCQVPQKTVVGLWLGNALRL